MSTHKSLLALAFGSLLTNSALAGTLSIGGQQYNDSQTFATLSDCVSAANSNNPSSSHSHSFDYAIVLAFSTQDPNELPPSSVTLSYSCAAEADLSYVLFGSTTTHYTVSGQSQLDVGEDGFTLDYFDLDSGTINQGPTEQSSFKSQGYDYYGQDNATVKPAWGGAKYYGGAYHYSCTVTYFSLDGSTSATAEGYSPPPPPPGAQNAALADFSGTGSWDFMFKSASVGSGGSGGSPPGGGTPPPTSD